MRPDHGVATGAVRDQRCRVLVGGFGLPGHRDLDFGAKFIRYAEELEWPEGVVVEDLSYSAHQVLHRLLELRPAKVVLVAAVSRGDHPPGSVRRYNLSLRPPRPEDVHEALVGAVGGSVDLDATLAVVRHWGCLPPDAVMIEVEASDASFGLGFSEELAGAIDPILTIVREELGGHDGGPPAGPELDAEWTHLGQGAPAPVPGSPPSPTGRSGALPGIEHLVDYAQVHQEVRRLGALQRRLPGLDGVTLAGRFQPWGAGLHVGGDWYDVICLEDGGVALVMGDVVGRGVEAASVMAQLRMAVRALALVAGSRPGRVVEHLHRLVESTGVGEAATVVYVVVDPSGGEAVFSSAGQCPPLLVTPGGGADFVTGGLSAPLGTVPGCPNPEATVRLSPGSTLLLFTDGLVESRSKPIDEGLDQLRRAGANGPPDLEALCDHVLGSCLGGLPHDDDLSLLAVRFGP